jgi:hypothetical protein
LGGRPDEVALARTGRRARERPVADGAFHHPPTCVGFLSKASNLVPGDTNGKQDAFIALIQPGTVKRVSVLARRKQQKSATTAIAVSGDCTTVAYVNRGKLYVAKRDHVQLIRTRGRAADPSFSTGLRNDLVFGARGGVYLWKGHGRPTLVGPHGRNPAYNDIKRQTVVYEKRRGAFTQIAYRDVGKPEKIISSHSGNLGNGSSTKPVIGNAGYYVTFESTASNLGVNALGRTGDSNGMPDAYLYTDVRSLTLVQSVEQKAEPLPGGGQNPSMSFYANYIVFDSPGPLGAPSGPHQVYMRWLGAL